MLLLRLHILKLEIINHGVIVLHQKQSGKLENLKEFIQKNPLSQIINNYL